MLFYLLLLNIFPEILVKVSEARVKTRCQGEETIACGGNAELMQLTIPVLVFVSICNGLNVGEEDKPSYAKKTKFQVSGPVVE